jgi:hypothetical protein
MKMFMSSLGGDARQWYKSLPVACISSLKDFHVAFHSYCNVKGNVIIAVTMKNTSFSMKKNCTHVLSRSTRGGR